MKRITVLTLLLALVLGLACTGFAAEVPDMDRPASLTLIMEADGKPLDSGKLTLFRVGEIAQAEGNFYFTLIPELADSGISLENLEQTDLAETLAELAVLRELEAMTAPVEKGKAMFSQLKPGLFVVVQYAEDVIDGFLPIRPFLISLPRWNERVYEYDLTARPKVSLEPEPTEPTQPKPPKPPGPNLPQTGQLLWPIPVLAVSGLACLVIGGFLCRRKKDDHET